MRWLKKIFGARKVEEEEVGDVNPPKLKVWVEQEVDERSDESIDEGYKSSIKVTDVYSESTSIKNNQGYIEGIDYLRTVIAKEHLSDYDRLRLYKRLFRFVQHKKANLSDKDKLDYYSEFLSNCKENYGNEHNSKYLFSEIYIDYTVLASESEEKTYNYLCNILDEQTKEYEQHFTLNVKLLSKLGDNWAIKYFNDHIEKLNELAISYKIDLKYWLDVYYDYIKFLVSIGELDNAMVQLRVIAHDFLYKLSQNKMDEIDYQNILLSEFSRHSCMSCLVLLKHGKDELYAFEHFIKGSFLLFARDLLGMEHLIKVNTEQLQDYKKSSDRYKNDIKMLEYCDDRIKYYTEQLEKLSSQVEESKPFSLLSIGCKSVSNEEVLKIKGVNAEVIEICNNVMQAYFKDIFRDKALDWLYWESDILKYIRSEITVKYLNRDA